MFEEFVLLWPAYCAYVRGGVSAKREEAREQPAELVSDEEVVFVEEGGEEGKKGVFVL